MAISRTKTNTDSLNTDIGCVETAVISIEKALKKIRDDFILLDTMWDGPASETFRLAYTDDLTELEKTIKSLKEFNSFEKKARDKYNSCEAEVSSIIASIDR